MNVGIIGCGASGMMAAISAAKCGHSVTVLEKNSRPGKKLLATGNGKCNFTNSNLSSDFYNKSGRALFEAVYNEFNREKTLSFFKEIGVFPYDKNGYIYPRSEQALSVVACLEAELLRHSINLVFDCVIESIDKSNQFTVNTSKGIYTFDKLIIAAGSNASPKTGSDGSGYGLAIKLGHKVKKPLPALCGLKCTGTDFKKISGVRCQAKVTLVSDGNEVRSDFGELQLTDYGISGIPVFQISGEAIRLLDEGHAVLVKVDYANDFDFDELFELLKKRNTLSNGNVNPSFLEGFINSKLSEMFCFEANDSKEIRNSKDIDKLIFKIAELIKGSEYKVIGHRGFDNCQVCTGGINTVDLKDTLESKICPNLYFAGEIIDIDGICGGYNLQWAWSSGYVAGQLN